MAKISMPFLFIFLQIFLHVVRPSSSAALHELIPFGADNGDILVPPGDDSVNSRNFVIAKPFRFFGQDFTSLYVNINGVISFQKKFSKFKPKRFPLVDTAMIAPFWADVVTTKGGAIWYRQTTSKNVLREASLDVRNAFPEFPNFSARWMFVATWEKVPFYGTKNKNITNTFQSVLLSDGRHSFVRFNYYNITWTSATTSGGKSSNGLGGTEASCGFNSGFGNYHYNVTNNGYRNISALDLPHKTNVKQPGVLMFRTDGITIQEPTGRTTKGGESEWVKMNFDEVCFGARNDAYGSFVNHVKGGRVAAIKLVYLRGFVRCANSAVHNSRWGCSGIKKLSHFPFNVIGTNQNNRVLFPKEEILVYSTMWYNLPFADNQHSNELVFTGDYFNSFHFPLNDQMKIWYGEDLANHSERDNHGRVCVDVYVKFI